MNIVVIGAGAVGSYMGLKLAQAGLPVCFLTKAGRAAAYRQQGLTLHLGQHPLSPPVCFSDDPQVLRQADVVLVCVKSGQTAEVARMLAADLSPVAVVLSLQNGVSNAEVLSAQLTQTVVATAVYVAVQRINPYEVDYHGGGSLALSIAWRSAPWTSVFQQAGIPLRWEDAIDTVLWEKLLINCALNAVSALTHLNYGQLARLPVMNTLLDTVVDEGLSVARAEGIALSADLRERLSQLMNEMAEQRSSTYADSVQGRPTEIETINGEIVRRAHAHGLAVPANLTLYALVQACDAYLLAL